MHALYYVLNSMSVLPTCCTFTVGWCTWSTWCLGGVFLRKGERPTQLALHSQFFSHNSAGAVLQLWLRPAGGERNGAMVASAAAAHAAKNARAKRLEFEGAELVENVFDQFDRDASGDIDAKELRKALKQLRVEVTEDEIDPIVKYFGGPEATGLDIQQFGRLIVKARLEQDKSKKKLIEASYGTSILPMQDKVREIYNNFIVVYCVAAVILGNFLINIIEKEIDPIGLKYGGKGGTWDALDK